jgi:hypothetical protein
MKHLEKAKKQSKAQKILHQAPVQQSSVQGIVSWFEVPVANLDRAMNFYSNVFEYTFETLNTPLHAMAFFNVHSGVGGALVYGDGCIPSHTGTLLYFNAIGGIDLSLERVIANGGQILMGKTLINEEVGFYSLVLDSEGNRLALCSKF